MNNFLSEITGGEICEDKKGTATCQFFKKFCKDEGDFGDTVRADCERTCGICHGPTRAPKPPTHPKPTKPPTKPPTKERKTPFTVKDVRQKLEFHPLKPDIL